MPLKVVEVFRLKIHELKLLPITKLYLLDCKLPAMFRNPPEEADNQSFIIHQSSFPANSFNKMQIVGNFRYFIYLMFTELNSLKAN